MKPVTYSFTEFIMTGLSTSHAYTFTHYYVNSHTNKLNIHKQTNKQTKHSHTHTHTHTHKQTKPSHPTTLTGTGNIINLRSRKVLVTGTSGKSGRRGQSVNSSAPNSPYRSRTAPLTSKVAFYIFIQQI